MKKFLVVILSILYMATASGATIHIHYCMDKLVEIGLGSKDGERCAGCGMEKHSKVSNACCKDVYKQVKTDKDHKVAEPVVFLMQADALTPVAYIGLPQIFVPSIIEKLPVSHAPPGIGKVNTYILHCVFRI